MEKCIISEVVCGYEHLNTLFIHIVADVFGHADVKIQLYLHSEDSRLTILKLK